MNFSFPIFFLLLFALQASYVEENFPLEQSDYGLFLKKSIDRNLRIPFVIEEGN